MVCTCEADTLVFVSECDVIKWAKHNVSARPALQPCVSVLAVRGI